MATTERDNAGQAETGREVEPVVKVVNGVVIADSRDVAKAFGKEHKNVIRDIDSLHCSAEFRRLNFEPFKIKDLTGESTSHYEMTRDGFSFLVLGFTGAKAGAFKEKYIATFNAMEAELVRIKSGAGAPSFDVEAFRVMLAETIREIPMAVVAATGPLSLKAALLNLSRRSGLASRYRRYSRPPQPSRPFLAL